MPLMKDDAPTEGLTSGVVRAPPPRSWLCRLLGRSTAAFLACSSIMFAPVYQVSIGSSFRGDAGIPDQLAVARQLIFGGSSQFLRGGTARCQSLRTEFFPDFRVVQCLQDFCIQAID